MITREYKETPLDGGQNPPKHVVIKYSTRDCPASGMAAYGAQLELVRHLAESPELLYVGFSTFQSLKIEHDGNKWVATLQAKI